MIGNRHLESRHQTSAHCHEYKAIRTNQRNRKERRYHSVYLKYAPITRAGIHKLYVMATCGTKRLVSPLLRRHVDFCRTTFSRTTCSTSSARIIDRRFKHNNKLSVLRYAPYSSSSSLSSSSINNNNNNNNNIIKGENENETTNTNTIPVPETLVSILDDNYQEMIDRIPLQDVRNFCFIAHVDHGKSSLSSRLLEITGNNGRENQKIALESARNNINALDNDGTSTSASSSSSSSSDDSSSSSNDQPDEKEQIQLLDTLAVERERGITVKASAASMLYPHPSAVGPDGVILLNCVDTPGHSDFSSEVARSLSFVQGAVLLLDAAQGIQAQTWTVYEKAKSMTNPPEVILALTKIDLGKLYEDTYHLIVIYNYVCVLCFLSLSHHRHHHHHHHRHLPIITMHI